MEQTAMLLREYWPLVLFALFGGFLLRRRASRRREALVARNTKAARLQGIAYAAPGGHDSNQGVIQGTPRGEMPRFATPGGLHPGPARAAVNCC